MEGTAPVQIIPTRSMSPQESLMAGLDPIAGAVNQYGGRGYETAQLGFRSALEQKMSEMASHRELAKAMILQDAYSKRALAMQGAYQERANTNQIWRDIQAMQQQIPAKDFPQYDGKDSVHSFYSKVVSAYQKAGSGKLDEETNKRKDLITGGVAVMTGIQNRNDALAQKIQDLVSNPDARKVANNAITFDSNWANQFSSTLSPDVQKQFNKYLGKRMTPQQAADKTDRESGGKGASVSGALNNFVENTMVPYFSDPQKLSQGTQFQLSQLKQEYDRGVTALDGISKLNPMAAQAFYTQRATTPLQQTATTPPSDTGLPPAPESGSKPSPASPMGTINPLSMPTAPTPAGRTPTLENSGILGLIGNRLKERVGFNSPYGAGGRPTPPWAVSYGGGGPAAPSPYAGPGDVMTALKALMLGTGEGGYSVPPRVAPVISGQPVLSTNRIPVMTGNQSQQQFNADQIAAVLGLYNTGASPMPVAQAPMADDSAALGLNFGGNGGY